MKRMIALITASMIAAAFAGCDDRARSNAAEPQTSLPEIAPVQAASPSSEKHGYGQGVEVDDKNRPLGALDFNAKYGKYNAMAIDEDSPKILLTFDQGYENGYTAAILDTLKEKNVRAVFFILQDYAERNPELVRRMIDEGHIIGSHSVTHRSMPELSAEECAEEVNGLNEYMQENFGVTPELFRPPMGEFSEKSLAITDQCGCKTVLWSFAYRDWDPENQPDPREAMSKLVGGAHEGAIYLLHSVSATNAEILPDLIDRLRAAGYEL